MKSALRDLPCPTGRSTIARMSTDPRLLWNGPKPEPRQPQPGMHLWTPHRDGHEMRAQMRSRGDCGVEFQLLGDGELLTARLGASFDGAESVGRRAPRGSNATVGFAGRNRP